MRERQSCRCVPRLASPLWLPCPPPKPLCPPGHSWRARHIPHTCAHVIECQRAWRLLLRRCVVQLRPDTEENVVVFTPPQGAAAGFDCPREDARLSAIVRTMHQV